MIGKFNSFQKSWLWKVIPIAIAVPFVIQSITGANLGTPQTNYLVSFSDKDAGITYNEYQKEYQQRYNSLLQSYGQEQFEQFMTPENDKLLRKFVLDNLINNRLRLLYAKDIGIKVTDNDIIQNIRENKAFWDANNRYSEDRIKNFLRYYGLTTEQYFGIVSNQLKDEAVSSLINHSVIVVPREIDINARLALPSAQIQVATIDASAFTSDITPTEEQLLDYYNKHRTDYAIPAEATFSYITYNRNDFLKNVAKPTDAEIKAYFDEHPEQFSQYTYQVSDIIVKDQRTADEVVAALESGMSFADAAKQYSTDFATKNKGGNLGTIRASDLPASLARVVEIMGVNSHSLPIKTEDGKFHIIYLGDKRFASTNLEQAKGQISDTLLKAKEDAYIQDLFAKVKEVVESNGKIDEVAKILGLKVITTQPFAKDHQPEGLPAEVAKLAFNGSLEIGRVNAPQAIGNGSQEEIIAQLDAFKDTIYRTLNEVRSDVISKTKLEIAQNRQANRLQQIANELNAANVTPEKATETLEKANIKLSDLRTLPFYSPGQDNLPFYQNLFTAKYNGHKVDYITVPVEDMKVVYFIAVHGFTTDKVSEDILKVFRSNYSEQLTNDYTSNFMATLRQKYDVKINHDMLGQSND